MIPPWKDEKYRRVYNKPEIKASLEVILSVFASLFMVAVAIRPTLGTIATLQKKIEDSQLVSDKMSTKIEELIKAQQDLSNLADRLEKYAMAVPDNHEIVGLQQRMELLASEGGLRVNSIEVDAIPIVGERISFLITKSKSEQLPPIEKGTNIAKMQIDFDVQGDQQPIMKYLTDLENMDRVILITDLTVSKDERINGFAEATGTSLRAVGKAEAYYLLATSEE